MSTKRDKVIKKKKKYLCYWCNKMKLDARYDICESCWKEYHFEDLGRGEI